MASDPCATLWEMVLPEECRRLPAELEAIDGLFYDDRFFAPYPPDDVDGG